jgi:hypothetical protein
MQKEFRGIYTSRTQDHANSLLEQHSLDHVSLDQLESQWNISWSYNWKKANQDHRRVLYQW